MTDFIHEPPKEPQNEPPASPEEPLDEKSGQKRVYGYILLLFVVAFSLLLWSFLMNQRSNEQVLSELRGNADALQTTASSLQSALEQNIELEEQVEQLEKENAGQAAELEKQQKLLKNAEVREKALTEELNKLKEELAAAQEELAALKPAEEETPEAEAQN